MNNDCIFAISEYMSPKQKRQLTPEFARKFTPQSVTVTGFKQLSEFNRWCQLFDMQNLKEVRFVMTESKLVESLRSDFYTAVREDGLVMDDPVGWVPPSVKKVTICCEYDVSSRITLPNTVEEVVIEVASTTVRLPDSVRKVHLMEGFDDVISQWPPLLEEIIIDGWCRGNGRVPVRIPDLPDTVKKITLSKWLDLEFTHWPESLETFVFNGNEDEFWWFQESNQIGIPDRVQVLIQYNEDEDHPWAEPFENVWDLA